jgi:hypothetical protein
MKPEEIQAIEDPDLRAATLRLELRRRQLGIVPETPEECERAEAWRRERAARRTETLADVLARGAASVAFEPAPETPEERADRLALVRVEARIPDAFTVCPKGCRWAQPIEDRCPCGARLGPVSWATLAGLRGPEGHAALSGVFVGGRQVTGAAAVAEIRRRTAGASKVVLLGHTRAGKSITAAAFAEEEIRADVERVRWTCAGTLMDPGVIDRALGAKVSILDDLGEDLGNAVEGSGVLAQRCAPVVEFVTKWARMRGKRLVVTTYLPFARESQGGPPGVAEMYGAAIASRLFEGAAVIRIGGA